MAIDLAGRRVTRRSPSGRSRRHPLRYVPTINAERRLDSIADLLRQVVRFADLGDLRQLRFEPIDVLLFAHQDANQ
jgi:hypothetical protein